jgi:hypothetical protein
MGWIGTDLDHTLAKYESGMAGTYKIGEPIPRMVRRIKKHLADGYEVRIMTARVNKIDGWDHERARKAIEEWCEEHLGQKLRVTNEKDFEMIFLYDDRAVAVEPDTGRLLSPKFNLRRT